MPKPSCHESHGRKPSIKGKGTFFLKNAKNRQRIRPLFQRGQNEAMPGKDYDFHVFRVLFAFFSRTACFYWIFHSSIRRVAETKLNPILKSLRESAAKGLA